MFPNIPNAPARDIPPARRMSYISLAVNMLVPLFSNHTQSRHKQSSTRTQWDNPQQMPNANHFLRPLSKPHASHIAQIPQNAPEAQIVMAIQTSGP